MIGNGAPLGQLLGHGHRPDGAGNFCLFTEILAVFQLDVKGFGASAVDLERVPPVPQLFDGKGCFLATGLTSDGEMLLPVNSSEKEGLNPRLSGG